MQLMISVIFFLFDATHMSNRNHYKKVPHVNQKISLDLKSLFFFAGKSALHWAAAVNNVEAAIVLLKNGANKDMQNNKVKQYPLVIYLALQNNGETSFRNNIPFVSLNLIMYCLLSVHLRRKPLYSWLPGKEATRLPRFCWTILPTEK